MGVEVSLDYFLLKASPDERSMTNFSGDKFLVQDLFAIEVDLP